MTKLFRAVAVVLLLLLLGFFFVVSPLTERIMNKVAAHACVPLSPQAQALHPKLNIADLHTDSLLWGRNLLERGMRGHVDVPRLMEGNVALDNWPGPVRFDNWH